MAESIEIPKRLGKGRTLKNPAVGALQPATPIVKLRENVDFLCCGVAAIEAPDIPEGKEYPTQELKLAEPPKAWKGPEGRVNRPNEDEWEDIAAEIREPFQSIYQITGCTYPGFEKMKEYDAGQYFITARKGSEPKVDVLKEQDWEDIAKEINDVSPNM